MATGGNYPFRSASTDPRPRGSWQRTTSASDKDDNVSLNSIPNELRPNNWDFSDWKPSAPFDNTKRRKKGNPEREREQSLSQDSPPPFEHHQRTPSTFPRTRITPSTPTSQRIALENLRQQLTFSDLDDVSNDGEKNNERNVPTRRGQLPNFTRQDMSRSMEEMVRPREDVRKTQSTCANHSRDNRQVKEGPDGGQIVGRLMQIRDYIKQANSMMEALKKTGSPSDQRKASKLEQVVSSMKQQEQSFMDLLQDLWQTHREDLGKLHKLLENLQEQESAYLGLLQQLLSSKDDTAALFDAVNQREITPRPESAEDSRSIDIDVQSETSETTSPFRTRDMANTEDMLQNVEDMQYNHLSQERASSQTRPRIEDKLGLSEEDDDDDEDDNRVNESPYSEAMDSTLVQGHESSGRQEWDFEDQELTDEFLEFGEGGGLEALKLQEQLLRKLKEQQEQMRALKGRQAALLALQKDAESKLAEARVWDKRVVDLAAATNNSVPSAAQPQHPGHRLVPQADGDSHGRSEIASDGIPRDEIRQQRTYLRNKLKEQNTDTAERQSNPELEAAAGGLDDNRQQLKDKLRELQQKKQTMDNLLQELSSLRTERLDVVTRMNNESLPPAEEGQTALAAQTQTNITAMAAAESNDTSIAEVEPTDAEAEELRNIMEAREKLRKLQEVKERLNQLRSLVDYYQTSTDEGQIPDVDERTAFQNMIEGYSQGIDPRVTRTSAPVEEGSTSQGATGISKDVPRRPLAPPQPQSKSDENNESDSDTSDESNLSSLGPWGDDPEIQEKVRKLKAAKEKLRQLQEIVSKVQQSPYAAEALPENIAELAASLDEGETQFSQTDEKNNSVSDGEVSAKQSERDTFYEAKMQEQMRELDQLKEERNRLLSIQQELQTLHDRCSVPEANPSQEPATERKSAEPSVQQEVAAAAPQEEVTNGRPSKPGAPVVTFSSNDEVYGKMRKQRMLREELRQKKRELEAIMKKDGSRKQYGKNQDNQSDTVSYTTDAFGAPSADATMATWGGSTVDNLESITEDEDGQQANNDMEEDDDAYPSDGILQVEEEEEENDSDNDTYTIENDVRQRRKAREQQRKAVKEGGAKPKKKQTFPRSQGRKGAQPKQSGWSRSYNGRQQKRNRQEDEDENDGQSPRWVFEALQQQLERTSTMCQSLLQDQSHSSAVGLQNTLSPSGYAMRSPGTDMFQQQLQQQQLMMSLNQCLQQMSMQQMEIQNMQRQMQNLSFQVVDQPEWNPRANSLSALPEDLRFRSLTSLPTGYDSRGLSPNVATRGDSFSVQPRFPSEFHNRRSTENLLSTERQESSEVFDSERVNQVYSSRDQHRMAVRSKTGTYSQLESTRKESQGGVKRKTSSLSERSRRNNSQQNLDETPEAVPSLNLQDILRRKRRQNLSQNISATSSFPSSMDASPDVTRNAEGVKTSTSQRAGLGRGQYRPGLSAGISGAGFQLENSSIASTMSNRVLTEDASASRGATANLLSQRDYSRDAGDPGDLSLFEALRESIYSEVATLISQNENRPHFLIELFRELQSVSSDYLRQRVLYSIKEIVSKYLTDQNASSVAAPPPAWINTNALNNYTASELTPSESLLTSDDEEVKLKVRETVSSKTRLLNRGSSIQNDEFDYMENADNDSSLSTPSNSYWDNPFAQESLGDTVIHLDKALKRMREYDRKIAESEAKQKALTQQREMRYRESAVIQASLEPTSSSAVDQGSESSVSSMSYPKIDTQQLDQQIKGIMTEVIPVIKEHMDHVCSSQLLAYIKRLVLSLTRRDNSNSQYSRFFHGQMSSTLQDTLAKFEGRKMRECGEDLLVDMSEALFNELAFFRLMEGLGEPPNLQDDFCTAATQTQEDAEEGNEELGDGGDDQMEESDTTETTATVTDDEEENEEEGNLNNSVRANALEEEDLGKARDDEFAKELQIQDADDKDNEQESPYKTSPVQIELAPSETKPFTRIGSDEDSDEDADESQSADDPSETAVSHMMDQEDGTTEGIMEEEALVKHGENEEDADQGAQSNTSGKEMTKDNQPNVHVNGEVVQNGEVTLDDLPMTLNVPREQIQNKLNEEQQNNNAENAAMASMDLKDELAGDGQYLKEPGS